MGSVQRDERIEGKKIYESMLLWRRGGPEKWDNGCLLEEGTTAGEKNGQKPRMRKKNRNLEASKRRIQVGRFANERSSPPSLRRRLYSKPKRREKNKRKSSKKKGKGKELANPTRKTILYEHTSDDENEGPGYGVAGIRSGSTTLPDAVLVRPGAKGTSMKPPKYR